MEPTSNVTRQILAHAMETPQKPAILDPAAPVTFDQLAGLAVSFALHMQARGVGQRATVAIASDDPLALIASALAAALLGAAWAP